MSVEQLMTILENPDLSKSSETIPPSLKENVYFLMKIDQTIENDKNAHFQTTVEFGTGIRVQHPNLSSPMRAWGLSR